MSDPHGVEGRSPREEFRLRRVWWATVLLAPLAPRGGTVVVTPDAVRVRLGWLGSADVSLADVAEVGRARWPWWAGVGVRIARSSVVFAAAGGDAVVVELREPVAVKAPMTWRTKRLVLVVEEPTRAAAAIAAAVELHRRGPGAS